MADVREQSKAIDEQKPDTNKIDAKRSGVDGNRDEAVPRDAGENIGAVPEPTVREDVPRAYLDEHRVEASRPGLKRKRTLILMLAGIVLVVGAVVGTLYYLHARQYASTDDAFIDGHIIQVSPKVSGYVKKVYVTDNQEVKEGDLLAEIDPSDYEARLQQAKATLGQALARRKAAESNVSLTRVTSRAGVQEASSGVLAARSGVEQARAQAAAQRSRYNQAGAQVGTAQANAEQARAQVAAAEAEARRANRDVQRYQELYGKDEISRQRLDEAIATAATANAQLEAARRRVAAAETQVQEARAAQAAAADQYRQAVSQVATAQAQVGQAVGKLNEAGSAPQQVAVKLSDVETSSAEIAQAEAAVRQAELDLSYTKIRAPEPGRVTKKAVEEGAFLQPGQALLALVPGDVWVVANYKETQLAYMRPGQPAEIKVDAYPDRSFKGHVDSIQSGTGSRFSLLPAENATGNYVKVVQRVPVKIVFDERPDGQRLLAPGMSVEPEVKVR